MANALHGPGPQDNSVQLKLSKTMPQIASQLFAHTSTAGKLTRYRTKDISTPGTKEKYKSLPHHFPPKSLSTAAVLTTPNQTQNPQQKTNSSFSTPYPHPPPHNPRHQSPPHPHALQTLPKTQDSEPAPHHYKTNAKS